jgi:hypothetical protein
MKLITISTLTLSLMLGSVSFAQNGGNQGPGGNFPPAPETRPQVPNFPQVEVPQEIIDLREEIAGIKEQLDVSRQAVIDALGDDPSREAVAVAMAAWHEANTETIDAMKALNDELRELIAENRPEEPRFEVPEEIQEKREDLRESRQLLAESRRQVILGLGENPADEDVAAALEAWKSENADSIEATKALSQEIRDWFRENRPPRPMRGRGDEVSQRRNDFQQNRQALRENRRALAEQMQDPNLTEEDRQALIESFREEQRDLLMQRKNLLRERRDAEAGAGGDRRPNG